MGISFRDAARDLKNRNIDFLLKAPPERLAELRNLDPSSPFYAGLLVRAAGDSVRAEALFEAALESPLGPVREAALEEVLAFYSRAGLDTDEAKAAGERLLRIARNAEGRGVPLAALRSLGLYTLGRFDEIAPPGPETKDPWQEALFLLAAVNKSGAFPADLRQRTLDFFFRGPPGPAQEWAVREWAALRKSFAADSGDTGGPGDAAFSGSESEAAAAGGRLDLLRYDYNAAFAAFSPLLEENPALFLEYPDLLGGLGRAFQYTKNREQGAELFSRWNAALDVTPEARYLLFYYQGRIERQLGRYDAAADFFARALLWAPDAEQEDACIWYILDTAFLGGGPAGLVPLLAEYLPRWHDASYFADILDRLARVLLINRDFVSLLRVFDTLRQDDGGADKTFLAEYAYIIGRLVATGYIARTAVGAYGGEKSARPEDFFFRTAFESDGSLYYRALAASFLGEEVNPVPEGREPRRGAETTNRENIDFFAGFFRFGAADYAFSYVEPFLKKLAPLELRALAGAFSGAELWGDSIRVLTELMDREDYRPEKRDMELYYPRPYKDLIEREAKNKGIPPEILFGLVRTESAFKNDVVSRAGAKGLTQLMPSTAMDAARRVARRDGPNYIRDGKIDLFDPEINVRLGSWYLRYLSDTLGSRALALLAYNGGIGRVRTWRGGEKGLPEDLFLETLEYAETRHYGKKVLGAAAAYGYLYYGMTMEEVIADIYGVWP